MQSFKLKLKYSIGLIIVAIVLFNIVFWVNNIRASNNFNSMKIKITVSLHKGDFDTRLYTIKLTNNTGYSLKHTSGYLSFPIKNENGLSSNPFVIEGKYDRYSKQIIKNHDKLFLTLNAPINKVFRDTSLIDLEHPQVIIKGFVIEGNKEVPYENYLQFGYGPDRCILKK
jgi:hypothetical protein